MVWKEHTDNALSKLLVICLVRTYSGFHFFIKLFLQLQTKAQMEKYWSFGLCDRQWERDTQRGFVLAPSNHITLSPTSLWLPFSKTCGFQIVHGLKSSLGLFPLEIMGLLIVKFMLGECSEYQFSDCVKTSIIGIYFI